MPDPLDKLNDPGERPTRLPDDDLRLLAAAKGLHRHAHEGVSASTWERSENKATWLNRARAALSAADAADPLRADRPRP